MKDERFRFWVFIILYDSFLSKMISDDCICYNLWLFKYLYFLILYKLYFANYILSSQKITEITRRLLMLKRMFGLLAICNFNRLIGLVGRVFANGPGD